MILKNKRILVTGGAGFIGSHIVDKLVGLKAKVYVIDNLSTGKIENLKSSINEIKLYKKDIKDVKFLKTLLPKIDYVCHQCALLSVPDSEKSPVDYFNTNVTATLNLLELCKKYKVSKIVIASSCAVYGSSCNNTTEKDDILLSSLSHYGLNKYLIEIIAKHYYKNYRLPITCLRYSNVYGKRQSLITGEGAVIPAFITKMLKSERPTIFGNGKAKRDFIYVSDIANANVRALEEKAEGKVYNIGTGTKISINELHAKIQQILKLFNKSKYAPKRDGDLKVASLNCSKARKDLNWYSEVSLDVGLKKTINWFRDNMRK